MGLSMTRRLLLVVPALLLAVNAPGADERPRRRNRTEHDALAGAQRAGRRPEPGDLQKSGRDMQVDERLGVPTFLWAGKPGTATPWDGRGTQGPAAAARRHLGVYGKLWDLKPEDVAAAKVSEVHDEGGGAVITKFKQEVGGVEVFRDELTVVMDRQLRVVAMSGYIPPADMGASARFSLSAPDAVARALSDFGDVAIAAEAVAPDAAVNAARAQDGGKYTYYNLASGDGSVRLAQPMRAKPVLFHLPEGLEAAYYVEIDGQTAGEEGPDSANFAYVVSATDGRLLFRHDLTVADSFSYRVWADTTGLNAPFDGPNGNDADPHPTGVPDGFQPPFVSPNLVTLQNGPISTNDPWLPEGATVTTGNNVDAYVDLVAPDGFTAAGDFRATTTAPGVFDRTYNTALAPSASADQRMASITQLFYINNWLHDWFYDAGFNEAAGNAQTDNYGRGGIGGDSIRAEAQDFSGTNNANMNTPADGGRPRMQMYVFSGAGPFLQGNAPASLAGFFPVATAAGFGAQTFTTTADVVWVDDGVPGAGGSIHDGCETPFANAAAVSGKIAFIDRGGPCAGGFAQKFQNAVANGAIGVLIANISTSVNPGVAPGMGGTSAVGPTVGALSLNFASGEAFRAQFTAGTTVNVTMSRPNALQRDGTIDTQIVSHEWGHYLTNRLIGNASGLSNQQGGGMGEGWGDFTALLLTVRPEDTLNPTNANFNGVYSMAGYATPAFVPPGQNFYFGIRRLPYSTDMTKNPLTFKHISDLEALPTTAPIDLNSSANSEVHNTGEVWATMMWESYAALLRDTLGASPRLSFDEARTRMRDYYVAALKITPNAPTILEARDALFTVAYLKDPVDYARFCQAFAKRGAGLHAIGPDRNSTNNSPVTESYFCGNDVTLTTAALDDSVASCDEDGVLDNVEIGRLSFTAKNVGVGALSATTATVASSNPHVSFPHGATVSLGGSAPFGTLSGSVDVELSGASGIEVADFTITFDDSGLPAPVAGFFSVRVNTDDIADASATDDVESAVPVWTVAGDPSLSSAFPWRRLEASAADHRWLGPNAGAPSDQYLISPVLHVGTSALSFTFRHRYSFEQPVFDGGVIELSNDGGLTWTDIGGSTSPGYNGTLVATGTNPLRGRPAFVNASAGYPAFITATVSLGTTYAGQDVQVRFRGGADDNTASVGWEIDDIAFSGITNTPFHVLVPHAGLCHCPAITLTPGTLPEWGKNVPYPATTLTPTAGVGPFSFNVAGLPAGMTPTSTVTGSDVTIAGTPTVNFNGTVTVTGADRFSCPLSRSYALKIAPPTISINDISVQEKDGFVMPAIFTISLSHPSATPVVVLWSTVDGTARANQDYIGVPVFVDIVPAFRTSFPLITLVRGDDKVEPNETFFVRLKSPTGATLGDAEGVCTILNDDTKKPKGGHGHDDDDDDDHGHGHHD